MWTRLLASVSRLRFVIARRRVSDDTAEELRSHLELLTARYLASGMNEDDARSAAARQLGNVTRVREEIYEMTSVRWFDVLVQDTRYALRVFARNPSFALVVILTLALGIGANSAILSVVYSVLLRPLPYAQPEQLYTVEVVIPERREQIPSLPATVQTFLAWRGADTAFSAMSAVTPWEASITGGEEPERLGGARISANFFSLLGVPLARGRGFLPDEEQPGRDRVVVISDSLWRRRFGANPNVIGQTVVLNGQNHQVVGIAAASLLVPTGQQLHALLPFAPRIDVWKPIAPTPQTLNNESWDHGVLVRLPDDALLERGRRQLETILNDLGRAQMPRVDTHPVVTLLPVREIYAANVRARLLLVLAASALLLLVACVSIANVFLARVARRANEFATRIALGAGRGRILSQTMVETILLALAGGAIGTAIARYGTGVLASYGPDQVRRLAETNVNWPMLLFALMVSLLTGAACGIVPAWHAYRRDPGVDLQESARAATGGPRARRARQTLVGVQMALATVLLASAGLLLHSFINVMTADRGYAVERVLAVDLSLFGQRYATGAGRAAFYSELVQNVRSLPGVTATGAISNLPAVSVSEGASRTIFHPTDSDFQRMVLERPVAMVRSVTPGYLEASGTVLRAGRFFADDEPRLVAVISESLGQRLWPGETPAAIVGRELRQGDVSGPTIAVAGVVAEARPGALDREPMPAIYRPYRQWASGPMTLLVSTVLDPSTVAVAVRSEIRKMDPNLPIAAMRTMREIVSAAVADRRFQLALTSLFAIVALLLGAVGVYGVVSYSVACRTRDIGLRMALGAVRTDVMRSVFADGMRPVLGGLAVGLAGTVALASVVRAMLFGVTPADPLSFGMVAIVLLLASAVACYLPARRAAALDPVVALRNE